jgi:hypothetical protein
MQPTIRSVALALVLLILASGAVHARPLAVHPAPVGFLEALWQWAAPYLTYLAPLSTSDSGGMMDPNGDRHNLLAPLPTSDAGSEMDPDG